MSVYLYMLNLSIPMDSQFVYLNAYSTLHYCIFILFFNFTGSLDILYECVLLTGIGSNSSFIACLHSASLVSTPRTGPQAGILNSGPISGWESSFHKVKFFAKITQLVILQVVAQTQAYLISQCVKHCPKHFLLYLHRKGVSSHLRWRN